MYIIFKKNTHIYCNKSVTVYSSKIEIMSWPGPLNATYRILIGGALQNKIQQMNVHLISVIN
jgi:hypothetical protein